MMHAISENTVEVAYAKPTTFIEELIASASNNAIGILIKNVTPRFCDIANTVWPEPIKTAFIGKTSVHTKISSDVD